MSRGKNIFQQVVDAFQDLSIFAKEKWIATVFGLLILVFVTFTSLVSFWAYNQILSLQEKTSEVRTIVDDANPSPKEMQKLLEKTTRQNILIDNILENNIISRVGDRAFLIRFHDGRRDINGTHFMYMSTTNQVTKLGVSNESANFKSVPTSMLPNEWTMTLLNKECILKNMEDLKDSPIKQKLMSMAVKTIKICPINSINNGNLLGLVGISWVSDSPSYGECNVADELIKESSAILSGILAL